VGPIICVDTDKKCTYGVSMMCEGCGGVSSAYYARYDEDGTGLHGGELRGACR
jgi:hypothetical protein